MAVQLHGIHLWNDHLQVLAVVSLVSSPVRPAVRQRGLARGVVQEAYNYRTGIHLDFTRDLHYARSVTTGAITRGLTTLFTFTGDNKSYYRGVGNLLVASVTNTPRIQYGVGGGIQGLLIEGERTNLWLRSREFSDASWTKVRSTATADQVAGPDGVVSADKITEDASAATTHFVRQDIAVTSGTFYTQSLFFEPKERSQVQLQFDTNLSAFGGDTIIFSDDDVTTIVTGTPTLYGEVNFHPWHRAWAANAATASVSAIWRLYMAANTTATYTGDGASAIYLDSAQLEVGKFPSSITPTTTAAVTRASETCVRTLSTEWDATAATICIRGRTPLGLSTGDQVLAQWDNASDDERIVLLRDSSGNMRAKCITGAAAVANLDLGVLASDTNFRVAFSAKANDFAASLNGGAVVTDSAGAMPTAATRARLGHSVAGEHWFGHILTVDQYPERKPNGFLVAASS